MPGMLYDPKGRSGASAAECDVIHASPARKTVQDLGAGPERIVFQIEESLVDQVFVAKHRIMAELPQ